MTESKTKRKAWTVEEGTTSVLMGSDDMRIVSVPPPETIRVALSWSKPSHAFGDEPVRTEVDWPTHWRMPLMGEVIRISKDEAAKVSSIDWDLETGVPVIHLR